MSSFYRGNNSYGIYGKSFNGERKTSLLETEETPKISKNELHSLSEHVILKMARRRGSALSEINNDVVVVVTIAVTVIVIVIAVVVVLTEIHT